MSIWSALDTSVLSSAKGYQRFWSRCRAGMPSALTVLGTLLGVNTARAACPITPDQVAVYVDGNLQGACRVLSPGFYGNAAAFGLPDNSISSVAVGTNVNVTLFSGSQSGTWKFNESSTTFFGSGYTVTNIGSVMNDQTSAIEVASRLDSAIPTAPVAHWSLGDNPSRFRGQWAARAEGLAHDSDNWYITNEKHIYKYPLTASLTGSPTISIGIPSELSALNCNHYGDPDVAISPEGEPFLFVPVEGCTASPFGVSELVAVFDSALNFVTFDALFAPEQAGHASWLAFQPTPEGQNLLFSSNYVRIGANDPVIRYELDWSAIFPDPGGHYILSGNTTNFFLTNESPDGPSFVDIANVQGGVFSDDGTILYISNGASLTSKLTCPSSRDGNGIHAFRATDFQRIAQSSNGFGGFNFANKPCSITSLEEVEGIDYVNMWDRGGAFNGFLHAMLISNVNNSVYLKHFNQ